ncbi:hypothetical protein [Thermococcus sp.]|uniref:hypothetical protein n=1 Tax=Thermococcus sp. TaxID=35749 RepID=UPI00260C2DE6|nr:hypothetical protein [Thermococcus sp.]
MEVNVSLNGNGRFFVVDQFSNTTVFSAPIGGHFNGIVVLPKEGSYAIYTSTSSLTFSGHYRGMYPTFRVQRVLYLTIATLSILFAVWRWWR